MNKYNYIVITKGGYNMEVEKNYLTVNDVCKIMGCSKPVAYKFISQCNNELKKMGKFVMSGKVNKKYFMSKIEV